jgi:hypothetical protein
VPYRLVSQPSDPDFEAFFLIQVGCSLCGSASFGGAEHEKHPFLIHAGSAYTICILFLLFQLIPQSLVLYSPQAKNN